MKLIRLLDSWLAGRPDIFIKHLLILLSIIGLLVAFFGTPVSRLALTSWYILP